MKTLGIALDAIHPYFLQQSPNWQAGAGKFLVKLAGGPARSITKKLTHEQLETVLGLLEDWGKKLENTPMSKRKQLFEDFKGIMHYQFAQFEVE